MKYLLVLVLIQIAIALAQDGADKRPWIPICDPPSSCPRPLVWNPVTCDCECGMSQEDCVNLQNFNPKTCRCDCDAQYYVKCPNFDVEACACIDEPCGGRTCDDPLSLNQETCECDCAGRTCEAPLILNPRTCKCDCDYIGGPKSCVNLQTFNPDSCACECNAEQLIHDLECHDFDFKNCSCNDANGCPSPCPPNFYQEPESCRCFCRKECKEPFKLDDTTCTCNCTKSCPENYYQDPRTCDCKCLTVCEWPFMLNEEKCICDCQLVQNDCINLQTLNQDKCACECKAEQLIKELNCRDFDYENCRCRDNNPNPCEFKPCPTSYFYQDPKTCECFCRKECVAPFKLDEKTCTCNCTKPCPKYYYQDPETCKCICRRECKDPFKLDEKTCTCNCSKSCPQNFYQDPKTCDCKCLTVCEWPWVLDPNQCKCDCKLDSNRCVNLQTVNPEKCACECKAEELIQQLGCRNFDYENCICLDNPDNPCPEKCPPNFEQDPKTCECFCRKECVKPSILNPKTCECDCPCGPDACGNLQNFNEETCLCECQAMTWVRCRNFDPITCNCPALPWLPVELP